MRAGPDDLLHLLGLERSASVDRLRAAYEGAVASATRRGDWQRAHRLSAAFDALSSTERRAVYAGHAADAPRWVSEPVVATRTRRRATRRQTASSAATRTEPCSGVVGPQWQMRRPYRIAAAVLVVVAAVCQVSVFLRGSEVAAWPVFAVAVGFALAGWLTWCVIGRLRRGTSAGVVEVVAWSSLVGMIVLIGVLFVANGLLS